MNNKVEKEVSNIIILDIGGIKFKTTKRTLQKYDIIFNGLIESCIDNNEIFIDRDGKYFEYILEFLRNGDNVILPDDETINKKIYLECQYYCLIELQNKIKNIYKWNETKIIEMTDYKKLLETINEHVNDGWISNDKTYKQYKKEHYENCINEEYTNMMKKHPFNHHNIVISSDNKKYLVCYNKNNEHVFQYFIDNKEILINRKISNIKSKLCVLPCFYVKLIKYL